MNKTRIADLIAEIEDETRLLRGLAHDIQEVRAALPLERKERMIHEESIALKLHNFYTGAERVFRRIADDINGGAPTSIDWHKRLLHLMTLELEGIRPPVVSGETEKKLLDFLAFRHIIRNIYGFQIDSDRLSALLDKFPAAFDAFDRDIRTFVDFLKKLGA